MHKTSLLVMALLTLGLLAASCSSPLQEAVNSSETTAPIICIYSEQVAEGYRVEFYEAKDEPGLIFTKEVIRDDVELPEYDWDSTSIEAVYKALGKRVPAGLTLALIRQKSYFEKCAAMPVQPIIATEASATTKGVSVETDKLGDDYEAWKKKYISKLSSFPDCRRYREVEGKGEHYHTTVNNEHKTRVIYSMRNNAAFIMIQEQKNEWNDWKVLYNEYEWAKAIMDGQETVIWTRDESGLRDYHYDFLTDPIMGGYVFLMIGLE